KRMPLAAVRLDARAANTGDELDRRPRLIQTVATSRHDLLVYSRVKFGKPLREVDHLALHGDRAKTRPALRNRRKIGLIDPDEPADPRPAANKDAGGPATVPQVNDAGCRRSEEMNERVEDMGSDIRGNSARQRLVALPGGMIPIAPGQDVGHLHGQWPLRPGS